VFFIGHSPGIVLAKATYGNRLAIYQGVTVGRNGDAAPVIEDDVILYPGSAAIGACRIARGSVLSQGTRLTDRDTEAGMIAFPGGGGVPVVRRPGRDLVGAFFRD
jgi:serine O-acetyltransferase